MRRYEESKRQGKVFTQRPVEFNPNRYVSVQTYENVRVNQPMSEVQFQSEISRFRRYWSMAFYSLLNFLSIFKSMQSPLIPNQRAIYTFKYWNVTKASEITKCEYDKIVLTNRISSDFNNKPKIFLSKQKILVIYETQHWKKR